MSKEYFSSRVLEEQLFNELKDISIKSPRYLRAKYEGIDIDFTRLHRRIVNYQIKQYGGAINNYVPRKNKYDLLKDNVRAKQRRYSRRNYERKN